MVISFLDFIQEKHVDFDFDSSGKKEILSSQYKSGNHDIHVMYTHHGKNHHTMDFSTNSVYYGNSNSIPVAHKMKLMQHLGHSIQEFVTRQSPKSLTMSADKEDPEHKRKHIQYEKAAKMVANKYKGIYSNENGKHKITFPHNNEVP